MRFRTLVFLAAVSAACFLSSCSDESKAAPPRTFTMGERITLGHLVYTVYETQWLTQLGEGADAHVPQNRYFLIRLSAVNAGNAPATVPNFALEDDNGNTYREVGGDVALVVPQYIGYLRQVKPTATSQGNALFDAPPRHYRLKLMDEESDKSAYVDIPLSFTAESPEGPQVSDPKKDQPQLVSPSQKK